MGDSCRPAVALLCLLLAACQPDLAALRREHAEKELAAWAGRTRVLERPITLREAIAIALENNLDYELARLQREVHEETLSASRLAMLPQLVTTTEYRWNSELRIASSRSADTGRTSLEPSLASERDQKTATFELVWSLLDFGLAFFRARQAANQAVSLEHDMRRTAQKLALEVTRAWYQLALAEAAVREARALVPRLEELQKTFKGQVRRKALSELEGLAGEETVVLVQMRLAAFVQEEHKARVNLASLMGLAAGARFGLAGADLEGSPARQPLDTARLEREALANRPELFQGDLAELVARDEARASLVSLFPSPSGFFGGEYDANAFLRHQFLMYAGARASWDLLSLPRKVYKLREAQKGEELARRKRLALAVGILTQTHLAVAGYQDALAQHDLAKNLAGVRSRKLETSRKLHQQGLLDGSKVLEAEANSLLARLQLMGALAQVEMEAERIANAVGRDPREYRGPRRVGGGAPGPAAKGAPPP